MYASMRKTAKEKAKKAFIVNWWVWLFFQTYCDFSFSCFGIFTWSTPPVPLSNLRFVDLDRLTAFNIGGLLPLAFSVKDAFMLEEERLTKPWRLARRRLAMFRGWKSLQARISVDALQRCAQFVQSYGRRR
jgi:hypothetical protein